MNFFCRIFGHTWCAATDAPEPRWNTTDDGLVLVASVDDGGVRHYDVCRRCGVQREARARRHDSDRPTTSLEGKPSA